MTRSIKFLLLPQSGIDNNQKIDKYLDSTSHHQQAKRNPVPFIIVH